MSRKTPVLCFDVMDTLVVDPFYKTMPAFFDMTFKELLDAKTPDAWPDFERGLISEEMLIETFFKDRRQIDGKGLKRAMANGYLWVPGMEEMLTELNRAGFELHACSNYPSWWTMIEGKLRLSDHLQWTFLSCQGPMKGLRKPEKDSYLRVIEELKVAPSEIIFVDDRLVNVTAAIECGIDGIHFTSSTNLVEELRKRGLEVDRSSVV